MTNRTKLLNIGATRANTRRISGLTVAQTVLIMNCGRAKMTRIEQLMDMVEIATNENYTVEQWRVTMLIDIALSMATIADALTEKGDNDDTV